MFEKDQEFIAVDKINKTPFKYKYIEKLKTIWHKIYSFESGNIFEVDDEWFNQRKLSLN